MNKKYLILFLSILFLINPAFSKTIEVFNSSNVVMDFQAVSVSCMKFLPTQFRLQPNESKKIDMKIDKNKDCPSGNIVSMATLAGWGTYWPRNHLFEYTVQMSDKYTGDYPYVCSKTAEGDNYCYIDQDILYHPEFRTEFDENYIYIFMNKK